MMYIKTIGVSVCFILISISSYSGICVGETTSYSCPGTSTKYEWSISEGGTMNPSTGKACNISVLWTSPGTHYVYYTDLMDSSNDLIYTVTVVSAQGGSITATDDVICQGGSTTLTLGGYSGTIVQWQQSIDGGSTWQGINSTASSYTTTNLQITTVFRCVVSNCSSQVTSAPVTITTVMPNAGDITLISGTTAACSGSSANGTLQLNNYVGLVKRWEKSEYIGGVWGGWTSLGNAVETFNFSASVPTRFRAVVLTDDCGFVASGYIETSVVPATTPGNIVISSGETEICPSTTFSLSVANNTGAVLQWYTRDEEHGWGNLSSPSNITINRPMYYKATVGNGSCSTQDTPELYVSLKADATIGDISPDYQKICIQGSAAFSISGFSGQSVLWQKMDEGSTTWTTLQQNTNASFTYTPIQSSGRFRAGAVNACGLAVYSAEAQVDVVAELTMPVVSDISICHGEVASLVVNNPQPAPTRYIWYQYTNDQYQEINAATHNQFNTSPNTNQTYYVAFEKNGCFSSKSAVHVNLFNTVPIGNDPYIQITTSPTYNVNAFKNNTSNADVTFYWQTELDGMSTSTSDPILNNPATGFYYVRARSSSGCWSEVSNPIEVINHTPKNYSYSSNQINFIRAYSFKTPSSLNVYPADRDSEPDPSKLGVATNYMDGLGRSIEKVEKKGSPAQKDLIFPLEYDEAGRNLRDYLPYVSTDGTGELKVNPFVDQKDFYFTPNKIASSNFPFTYKQIEHSPLDRPKATFAPGEDWAGSVGTSSSKGVNLIHNMNGANEVLLFIYQPTTGLVSTGANYAAGQLRANKTTDEHQNEVIEYVDKDGHTVCKKVQYGSDANGKLYASTYYIYDDFGNLVVVLPPEAIKSALNSLTQY